MIVLARVNEVLAVVFMLLAVLRDSEVTALCGIIMVLIAISTQIGYWNEESK